MTWQSGTRLSWGSMPSRWLKAVLLLQIISLQIRGLMADEQSIGENRVAEIIAALPVDTESIIVTTSNKVEKKDSTPHIRPTYDPGKKVKARPLDQVLKSHNTSLFRYHDDLKLLCDEAGTAASVFGARKFITQGEIGHGTTCEGCQVIFLRPERSAKFAEAFKHVPRDINGMPRIQVQTKEPWNSSSEFLVVTYVAPENGVIIAATSSTFLSSVIDRLRGKEMIENGLEKPDWTGDAEVWGVRRFGPTFSPESSTSFLRVDKSACGLEFAAGKKDEGVAFRYRSENEERSNVLQRMCERVFGCSNNVRAVDGNTCEISVQHSTKTWFGVIALMGYVAMP